MRGALAAAVAVALLVVVPSVSALPLPVEPAAPPPREAERPTPSITDPAGDAREYGAGEMAQLAANQCRAALRPVAPRCSAVPTVPTAAGVPAPAGRDIVALRFGERPDALVVELDLATLDAGFQSAFPVDGESVSWFVCWTLGELECGEGAWLWGGRLGDRLGFESVYWRVDDACNDIRFCEWEVPYEVLPGTPGTIRWSVPRAFLADGSAGVSLERTFAYTLRTYAMSDKSFRVSIPGQSQEGNLLPWSFYLVDEAGPGTAFRLESASTSLFSDHVSDVEVDDDGDVENVEQRADADILDVTFLETPTNLTVAARLSRVEAVPHDLELSLYMGFSNGPFVGAVVYPNRDERRVEGIICADPGCTYLLQIFPELNVTVGEPGWINLTYSRVDLRYPQPGDLLTEWALFTNVYLANGTKAGPFEASARSWMTGDWMQMGPAYAFRVPGVASPVDAGEPAVSVRDPANDVELPPYVDATQSAQYDIVIASIEGVSPTMTRFSLGVQDLSRITVPSGWQAILYAIAVETDQGLFMAGYHKDQGKAQFFCAPDTTVLTDEMRDPAEVIWRTIEGTLSLAKTAGKGGGGASASSIIFNVPHECFGVTEPGTILARQMAAGVYLIPQSANGAPVLDIARLDSAPEEPVASFMMGVAVATAPAPAWYAQPFGIENFWDITGILGAVAVSGLGVLAVRRRRGIVQRYMEQIDRAVAHHRGNTKELEVALVGIRRRLHEDLIRGRIEQAHHFVVEQRLNEHLTGARLAALSEAFGDLPHRLLQRLLQILGDGTITREEARRFAALLEDSGLTEEAKERVRRKLDLWVVEDLENPVPR